MKILNTVLLLAIIIPFARPLEAQQAFQDLNFESANLSPVAPGSYGVLVPVTKALPGWTVYVGSVAQTQVQQNSYNLGQAAVDIFGPNYPAAGAVPGYYGDPGTIDGNYSVLLQAGGDPAVIGEFDNVSIAQYGTVPLTAQTLEFEAWTTSATQFTVSFGGNSLAPVMLGGGANYTLYGVNISPYAGQSGTLQLTSVFATPGSPWLGLDDISFSNVSVVPEPNAVALTVISGLIFGARKRFAWRCLTKEYNRPE